MKLHDISALLFNKNIATIVILYKLILDALLFRNCNAYIYILIIYSDVYTDQSIQTAVPSESSCASVRCTGELGLQKRKVQKREYDLQTNRANRNVNVLFCQ